MSKAIQGAVMLAGAVGMGVLAFYDPALLASPLFDKIWAGLILGGVSMEAGAIASALTSNRGTNITTRQTAAYRQIIYGEQRVGGISVYQSTTGGHHDQYNYVIVLAGHPCESIENLYLDSRKVYWTGSNTNGNVTFANGTNFGGPAAGGDHIGPGGQHYDFGSLVYCECYMGHQTSAPNTAPGGGFSTGLQANDPEWAPSASGTPYLGGCTYVYLKIEYDTAMFPGMPEIRFTVRGKNNIFDPRTGTYGYTSNWALIVGDVLVDTQFGLGDVGNVNQDQLIAAANICDENVTLAAGGTEKRYACHWHYDTSADPGSVLSTIMVAAAGRLSQISGQWCIWPASWQGPSSTFDQNALTDRITWNPNRSLRDLYNRVNGTYIAPNYPFNTAGNLYDSNGWYDGTLSDTFPFEFQPTNYPQYACDTRHGYSADQYLIDDGKQLTREIVQSCCLSVAQSQRVAKIMLLRNRQQGSGTFEMNLAAWEMQPIDVMQFTFPAMGWTDKTLEVVSTRLKMDDSGDVTSLRVTFGVQETDESVYEWSTVEELTVYDVPANPRQAPYTPAPPTGMSLTSGASTALVGPDGIVRPRVEVQWAIPLDILVKQVQTQYQQASPVGPWIDAGLVDVANTLAFVEGVVAGQQYNFRIRSLRANGAASAWEEIDGYAVSLTLSSFTQLAMSQSALIGEAFTDGTAGIIVEPFTAVYGSLSVAILSGGAYSILGLVQQQLYFVYYVDPTFSGGSITPVATLNQADYLNKVGYFFIGSIVTPYAGTSGGGTSTTRYVPNRYDDNGSQTTVNPASAYDGNTSSFAGVGSNYRPSSGSGSGTQTLGICDFSGFPSATSTAGMAVNIVASFSIGGASSGDGEITIGGSSVASFSGGTAKATYTFPLTTGTALDTLTVEATATAATGGSSATFARLSIFEIYVQ